MVLFLCVQQSVKQYAVVAELVMPSAVETAAQRVTIL
jgi:hypothetical protein